MWGLLDPPSPTDACFYAAEKVDGIQSTTFDGIQSTTQTLKPGGVGSGFLRLPLSHEGASDHLAPKWGRTLKLLVDWECGSGANRYKPSAPTPNRRPLLNYYIHTASSVPSNNSLWGLLDPPSPTDACFYAAEKVDGIQSTTRLTFTA